MGSSPTRAKGWPILTRLAFSATAWHRGQASPESSHSKPATTPDSIADCSCAACTARLASVAAIRLARHDSALSKIALTRAASASSDSPCVTMPATSSSRSFARASSSWSEVVSFVERQKFRACVSIFARVFGFATSHASGSRPIRPRVRFPASSQ